ncbi:hypothetical protein BN8_03366 [Fibrisoma limi BUZ 3]|uniref:SGNH hydrolase-type esterase domain-containing protein n=1 Tax=Fibrisoma limi BUZ 3 TaxID=1185876 RepID=I2GJZ3_9BACT|nr:hypothetical protein [Fibrisoma limi]CCH54218.1 hypothetical protein BN8_03366 [Fibrisoma limi BUZ 3]
MRPFLFLLLLAGLAGCTSPAVNDPSPATANPTTPTDPTPGGSATLGNGQPGVVGIAGISAWDNLSPTEKARIKGWTSLFVHASVGGDLEDGSQNNGVKFEFYDGNTLYDGPNGADWNSINNGNNISNGEPDKKMAAFKREAIEQKGKLQIAIFKFGYADITDANVETVKTGYKQMIDELRAAGIKRFVHITPPLIYIVTKDDGNAAKMKVGQWMKDTFKAQDVVFDLQEIESDNGACKLGNAWTICDKYRSTVGCPSKGQGVDAPEGQGHLCETAATRISKAFLYAIYQTAK